MSFLYGFNPFLILASALMASGAVYAFREGNWMSGVIYVAYAVANVMLAMMKG